MSTPDEEAPRLDKTRHVKYWMRCLKTLLPRAYTSNDSNRMYLGFFIISALDLLDAWSTVASAEERGGYVDWIYRCQHPQGGFRMWPGTDFGERANEANAKWDPANVPATYFALAALLTAGDDLKRVKRKETLRWLRRMQRDDGSFGETLVDGVVEGGRDPRFGYCATGARYILRGDTEGPITVDGETVEDIEIDGLVKCVELAETFDGGIADQPFHEPHAGYTFCSLGCLKFVGRLRVSQNSHHTDRPAGPANPWLTLGWLAARQTDLLDPDAEDEDVTEPSPLEEKKVTKTKSASDLSVPIHQSPDKSQVDPAHVMSPFGVTALEAGMNGRPNKVADTCYAWWTGGSFHILEQPTLYNKELIETYLLGKTQHAALGGFGKFPGDLPDLYHSYLGLAALGLGGIDGIKDVDGSMCISKEASSRLHSLWQ